jgi:hypothetical protein
MMEKRRSDLVVFVKDGGRVVKMGDWLRKLSPANVERSLAANAQELPRL